MKRAVVQLALVVLAAIAPGIVVAMVIGGGAHSADPIHVTIGLIVEW